jgi:hypothetical protein
VGKIRQQFVNKRGRKIFIEELTYAPASAHKGFHLLVRGKGTFEQGQAVFRLQAEYRNRPRRAYGQAVLAFKTRAFSRFRHCLSPVEYSTWAILDAGITLCAFFCIDAELQHIHFSSCHVAV